MRPWHRAKNFEKGSEYANTWKKDEDGAVNTDGPRVVVGDMGGPQGGYVTRCVRVCVIVVILVPCVYGQWFRRCFFVQYSVLSVFSRLN